MESASFIYPLMFFIIVVHHVGQGGQGEVVQVGPLQRSGGPMKLVKSEFHILNK